jgi:hypothetical protein
MCHPADSRYRNDIDEKFCIMLQVAIKLAPDRNKFMEIIGGGDINADIEKFYSTFAPFLEENHKFLV